MRLAEPTAYYNCHSFAWYDYSYSNSYWLFEIDPYVDEDVCRQIYNTAAVQVGDIVVYYDSFGDFSHSGVVYSVNSGNLTIRSKWGQGGVYEHSFNNHPYTVNGTSIANVYRFHNYGDFEYLDSNYHSGNKHYYLYGAVCQTCGNIGEKWFVISCLGNCIEPWSLRHTVSKY